MAVPVLASKNDNKSGTVGVVAETLLIPTGTGRLDLLFETNAGEYSKDGGTSWFPILADLPWSAPVLGISSLQLKAAGAGTVIHAASWPGGQL